MFEVGFTEIILILGLALLVLGPEKLPGLAEKIGRWTGRARSMARQLRSQLEQEVTLEQMAKSKPMQAPPYLLAYGGLAAVLGLAVGGVLWISATLTLGLYARRIAGQAPGCSHPERAKACGVVCRGDVRQHPLLSTPAQRSVFPIHPS